MHLVPLMSDTLDEARWLAANLFPWEHEHQAALAASLAPERHAEFYIERHLATVQFWTSPHNGHVGGLAGLYNYTAQPEETWLAWFGLCEQARGRGQGAALLDEVIAEVSAKGKLALRLWTTDEEEYAKAMALYLNRGFRPEPWPALPGETWRTQVLSIGLNGHQPLPWARRSPGGTLCGQVAPQLVAA